MQWYTLCQLELPFYLRFNKTDLGTVYTSDANKKISATPSYFSYNVDIELKSQHVDIIFHNVEESIAGNYYCEIKTYIRLDNTCY